jgi:hypothetical protein
VGDALLELRAEAGLQRLGPVEPARRGRVARVVQHALLLLLAPAVLVLARAAAEDAERGAHALHEPAAPVRVVVERVRDRAARPRVLPQEVRRVYSMSDLALSVQRRNGPVYPCMKYCMLPIFSGSCLPFFAALRSIQS